MDFLSKYGIEITNNELLSRALCHSSYVNECGGESYERLEFLGDSVLSLCVSDYLYNKTSLKEGQMSKERAKYVCEDALYNYVKKLGYEHLIKVSNGLKGNVKPSIVADTFEAVLAVIYLEKGLDVCKKYIKEVVIPSIEEHFVFFEDYKSVLQEMVQTNKKSLEYVLLKESGEAHNMTFTVSVVIDNITLGVGTGKSKKEAEQMAAKEALAKSAR